GVVEVVPPAVIEGYEDWIGRQRTYALSGSQNVLQAHRRVMALAEIQHTGEQFRCHRVFRIGPDPLCEFLREHSVKHQHRQAFAVAQPMKQAERAAVKGSCLRHFLEVHQPTFRLPKGRSGARGLLRTRVWPVKTLKATLLPPRGAPASSRSVRPCPSPCHEQFESLPTGHRAGIITRFRYS